MRLGRGEIALRASALVRVPLRLCIGDCRRDLGCLGRRGRLRWAAIRRLRAPLLAALALAIVVLAAAAAVAAAPSAAALTLLILAALRALLLAAMRGLLRPCLASAVRWFARLTRALALLARLTMAPVALLARLTVAAIARPSVAIASAAALAISVPAMVTVAALISVAPALLVPMPVSALGRFCPSRGRLGLARGSRRKPAEEPAE